MTTGSERALGRPLIGVLVLLAAAAAATLAPFGPWLILALWFGGLARPLHRRWLRRLGGRHRAAAVLTTLLFLVVLTPPAILAVSLVRDGVDLGHRVLKSGSSRQALEAIVAPDGAGGGASQLWDAKRILGMVQEHGSQAWDLVTTAAGAASSLAVGLFIFFWGSYAVLADGSEAYDWFEDHLPVQPAHFARLAAAFRETGRGLLVSVGLTGLAQTVVATLAYAVLGVPRALVLGLFTLLASVIPSVGCALVWVPVAAALALTGQPGKGIILAVVGVGVVSTIDNVLRPVFAGYGNLKLPSFVLLVAMFGGLAVFGGWGLLLGPLLVRLAKEGLEIARYPAGPQNVMASPPRPGPTQ